MLYKVWGNKWRIEENEPHLVFEACVTFYPGKSDNLSYIF